MDQLRLHGPLTGEALTAFVCFVLADEAQRPSVRGRRQKLPLQGRQVSYGVKVQLRRGSDRAERIYVTVTAFAERRSYQLSGVLRSGRAIEIRPRRLWARTTHSQPPSPRICEQGGDGAEHLQPLQAAPSVERTAAGE